MDFGPDSGKPCDFGQFASLHWALFIFFLCQKETVHVAQALTHSGCLVKGSFLLLLAPKAQKSTARPCTVMLFRISPALVSKTGTSPILHSNRAKPESGHPY